MKTILLLKAVMIASVSLVLGDTKRIEGTAEGKEFNKIADRFLDAGIYVYVDNDGDFYIASTSGLNAAAHLKKDKYKSVLEAAKKGVDWQKKARKAQLETQKEIASFFTKSGHRTSGVGLTFFSSNKGKQTDVIIEVKDFSNSFNSAEVYLNQVEMEKFVKLLEKIPQTVKKLKEDSEKASDILD